MKKHEIAKMFVLNQSQKNIKILPKFLYFFFTLAIILGGVLFFSGEAKADLAEGQLISLTETTTDLGDAYVIENDYYKAVILKASASKARGMIRWLYVKNNSGEWSNNLICEKANPFGLGFLEGSETADISRCTGLQDSGDMTLTILENTSK